MRESRDLVFAGDEAVAITYPKVSSPTSVSSLIGLFSLYFPLISIYLFIYLFKLSYRSV